MLCISQLNYFCILLQVKRKYLIIVSASFPYGLKEPFLETELKHHALHFDKIYLLVPKIPKDQSHHFNFTLPQNVIVAQFLYTIGFWERLMGIRFLFSFVFRTQDERPTPARVGSSAGSDVYRGQRWIDAEFDILTGPRSSIALPSTSMMRPSVA